MNSLDERLRDALHARADQVHYDVHASWHRQRERKQRQPRSRVLTAAAAGAALMIGLTAAGWHLVHVQRAIPNAPLAPARTVEIPASAFSKVTMLFRPGYPILDIGRESRDGTEFIAIAWAGTDRNGNEYDCTGYVPTRQLTPVEDWNCQSVDKPGRTRAGLGGLSLHGYPMSDPVKSVITSTVNDKVASLTITLDDGTACEADLFGRAAGFPATVFRCVLPVLPRQIERYTVTARDVNGRVIAREENTVSWTDWPAPDQSPAAGQG
jgi:hypothetical protein